VETFRRLRKLKNGHFGVYFGMTLQDANAAAYEDTVYSVRKHIKDIRHDDFHVNVMHTSSHYYANTEFGGIQDKQHVLEGLGSIMQRRKQTMFSPISLLELRYQKMARYYLRTGMAPVSCQALSASLFMDPSGTVYPCTIFDSPIGNMRDFGYDLHELWNSAERHSLRQEILKGNCPHCWTPCEAYQSILANVVGVFRRN
jgi:MoaA/NifB/PqqE/SkfB family radical SAM enzyme